MTRLPAQSFVHDHHLWSKEQAESAERALATMAERGIEKIRLSFPDQHGVLRGKTVLASEATSFLVNGCAITSTLLLKDTSHRTVFPLWTADAKPVEGMRGASDVVMVPDPDTFRILPWSPDTAAFLCDLHHSDGSPVTLATRYVARQALKRLETAGFDFVGGLEVELHVYRLVDAQLTPAASRQPAAPPEVALLAHGYQYLTEQRFDQLEPAIDIIRETCRALNLPLRTLEVEFGPSQIELTLSPERGLAFADNMIVLRNAVKQACRRQGYHATFMCRPHLENAFSSGWHLHQSLIDRKSGQNVFHPTHAGDALSETGRQFAAGILASAREGCLLSTPTVTGYKRYRPHSLAPNGIAWGRDNRAAMLRVITGGSPSATRIENRIGEPAANPYLYLVSQALAGLAGITQKMVPPEMTEAPYAANLTRLPTSLIEAVALFRGSDFWRKALSADFVDYYAHIKQAEVDRFLSETTDWEHREYFDLF